MSCKSETDYLRTLYKIVKTIHERNNIKDYKKLLNDYVYIVSKVYLRGSVKCYL